MSKVSSARLLAVKALQMVNAGQSLAEVLPTVDVQVNNRHKRATTRALVLGVLRCQIRLDALLAILLKKPLAKKDQDIQQVLRIGLYQLDTAREPDYAVVSESVKAVRQLDKSWASGLTNAVLRQYQRDKAQLSMTIDTKPAQKYSLPDWLYQQLLKDWADYADLEGLLHACNQQPALTLRVNRQKMSVAEFCQHLEAAGIAYIPPEQDCVAVVLQKNHEVMALPGYQQGWFAIQDRAAQQAVNLLNPQAGDRVLDACAAPGGKTTHLLEYQPAIEKILAVDIDQQRLQRVKENVQRLAADTSIVEYLQLDMVNANSALQSEQFDRILLDVPCSATGILRRYPDIKLHRRLADIEVLLATQQQLLQQAWILLKSGGVLLYCTCSILKQENVGQINSFLQMHKDAIEQPLVVTSPCLTVVTVQRGLQLLPGDSRHDGFYYALLQKKNR